MSTLNSVGARVTNSDVTAFHENVLTASGELSRNTEGVFFFNKEASSLFEHVFQEYLVLSFLSESPSLLVGQEARCFLPTLRARVFSPEPLEITSARTLFFCLSSQQPEYNYCNCYVSNNIS